MTTDKYMLFSRARRFGDDTTDIRKALGLSERAFYAKLNGRYGKRTACFSQDEIQILINRYGLTPMDVCSIFFPPKYTAPAMAPAMQASASAFTDTDMDAAAFMAVLADDDNTGD